nr:ABC transporter permease subunit [Paenibacillus bovis]
MELSKSQREIQVKQQRKIKAFWNYFKQNYDLYLMSIPGLLFVIVYKFIPLFGLTIAFKDFNIFAGDNIVDAVINSPSVGIDHFKKIFSEPELLQKIWNTIIISVYKIVFLFPLPILLALLLNEVRLEIFKRTIQTLVYLPHFLSWVVVFGLFATLLGNDGIFNNVLASLGFEKVNPFTEQDLFRGLLVTTEGWKEVGWSAIIFLAALTGIDLQQYEAAKIDGANRFQRMVYISIPGIFPVVILMLILRVGQVLNAGFEQILAMYNPAVYEVGDIIQTFVYRIGLGKMDFSLGTALGLFESVVAFILIVSSNAICRKTLGRSIW